MCRKKTLTQVEVSFDPRGFLLHTFLRRVSGLFHSTNAVGVVKSDCVCGRCCSWRHRDVKRSVGDLKPVRRKRQADRNLEFNPDSWVATQSRLRRRGRSGEGEAGSQPRAGGYGAVGPGRGKPANLKVGGRGKPKDLKKKGRGKPEDLKRRGRGKLKEFVWRGGSLPTRAGWWSSFGCKEIQSGLPNATPSFLPRGAVFDGLRVPES